MCVCVLVDVCAERNSNLDFIGKRPKAIDRCHMLNWISEIASIVLIQCAQKIKYDE